MFADCPKNEGLHTIELTAGNLAAGNYLYKIEVKTKGEKPAVFTGTVIKD
jgi:hypothetical protein